MPHLTLKSKPIRQKFILYISANDQFEGLHSAICQKLVSFSRVDQDYYDKYDQTKMTLSRVRIGIKIIVFRFVRVGTCVEESNDEAACLDHLVT